MEPSKAEIALMQANAFLAQLVPLVGVATTLGKGIYTLLKANGLHKEAEIFLTEMDAALAERRELGDAQADFWKKYPLVPINETESKK